MPTSQGVLYSLPLPLPNAHGVLFGLPLPLPNAHGVLFSLPLPLPTAQKVLTSFSSPSSTAEHEFLSSRLTPFQHNAILHHDGHALHDSGTLLIQAPLVTHRCHAYWRFGFSSWKCPPKILVALLSLFKYLSESFVPLSDILYHFVVSIQTIGCASSVCHLPPYHTATLLRHDLRRSLCSKHDFLALKSRLLSKLSIWCRNLKYLWLLRVMSLRPRGHNFKLVKANLCVKSRLRFKYHRVSPVSVNKMICLLQPFLIAAASMAPASHHARLQENLGGGAGRTYSLAQLNEHLVVGSLKQEKDSVFRYVAHVDDVGLLKYPFPAYIHCRMPIETLLPMLPVTHA